jgi:hypothetical protein
MKSAFARLFRGLVQSYRQRPAVVSPIGQVTTVAAGSSPSEYRAKRESSRGERTSSDRRNVANAGEAWSAPRAPIERAKRLLIVSSSGGVLLDVLALEPWWSRYDAAWAVVEAADTASALAGHRVHWIWETSIRNPLAIFPGLARAWRILRGERPELIVSAGSGPAISFFLVARVLGIPTFWVSTLNVLTTPGISAKICARLSSRVLLQQSSMLGAHPNGLVIGELY